MIYLDNAATTKVDNRVIDAMMPYLTQEYGNPGTMYKLGRQAREAIEKARQQVANFINSKPEQILFTSSGSEANNLAICGLRSHLLDIGKTEIITSPVEHDSVLNAIKSMCIKDEFHTQFLPTFSDKICRTVDLNNTISDKTGLVTVMYANNETGLTSPVKKIGKVCKSKNIFYHIDCVQAAGCYPLDVGKLNCTSLSISGHKLHSPKGIGAIYIRDKEFYKPIINGGSGQEFGLRAGTENVANIVGFGTACEMIMEVREAFAQYISNLKMKFYNTLVSELTSNGYIDCLHINGCLNPRDGKVINIRFDGVDGQTLLLMLDSRNVCVSAGSACSGDATIPSHVLLAIGVEEDDAINSIRVSFSASNTEYEVIKAAKIIAKCIEELKNIEY